MFNLKRIERNNVVFIWTYDHKRQTPVSYEILETVIRQLYHNVLKDFSFKTKRSSLKAAKTMDRRGDRSREQMGATQCAGPRIDFDLSFSIP